MVVVCNVFVCLCVRVTLNMLVCFVCGLLCVFAKLRFFCLVCGSLSDAAFFVVFCRACVLV